MPPDPLRAAAVLPPSDCATERLAEGIARVLRIDGATVWLEAEPQAACGACAAAGVCGMGRAGASGAKSRHFALANPGGLAAGDRVVVGVTAGALLRAALTAYALPMAATIGAGALAVTANAGDATSMLAVAAGLFGGLICAQRIARRLEARGELSPRFLRRLQATAPDNVD